ncbi:DPY30/SDC1 family protein [Aspergillus ruber CBS 135680]|uniref:COMPASS complex subunit Sdc1 n=1 Tax=Aspergillus ruber (strain CBS 135680) TaxID=1388766 RepID=A0A017SPV5_ASPRC|nr:uncharacterized protein EURHEDRAFT_374698 [Aspergillus ruber CBS 135680]EYE98634.1 hypothetical protein EURHEDRAFT_374698 [Aspergillus ruber CBS 135680]
MATDSPLAGTPAADSLTTTTTPQTQSQPQSQAQTGRPGGAPARVYMNENIVPYLLEGMKGVAKEQPANPLRVLGEFLIQKSAEVEGKAPE